MWKLHDEHIQRFQQFFSPFLAGNHYGTPKPPKEASTSIIRAASANAPSSAAALGSASDAGSSSVTSSSLFQSGAHPSSEGKRRRNRSNVEAMTAKHTMNDDGDDDSGNGGGSIETAKDPDASSTVVTGGSVAERAIGGGADHNGESKSFQNLHYSALFCPSLSCNPDPPLIYCNFKVESTKKSLLAWSVRRPASLPFVSFPYHLHLDREII